MLFEQTSYRSYLKAVYADRRSRNPSYSMRAMARDLGLNPAHLIGLNRGTKGLSLANAVRISNRLGLPPTEADYFCTLVQYESSQGEELRERFLQRLRLISGAAAPQDLEADLFKMIADWYHIPILEMTGLHQYKISPESVSERLGISRIEAEVAIERLERLELLVRQPDGRSKKSHKNYVFASKKPNPAMRRYHTQMLYKAIASLEAQAPEERYIGSQTFVIDPAQIDQAREVIEECRRKLSSLFDTAQRKTEAYQLEVAFFRLTNRGKK